jgi:two-component system nitrate/nitrite response regulator NarL
VTAVRVLVFAKDPLARAGLATLLAGQEGVIVVGRVGTSDDLAGALDAHRPDVVLCDMGWEPETALAHLAENRLGIPIGVLAIDEESAQQGWRAGVQGVLRRDAEPASIAAAVVAVAQGFLVVDAAYRTLLAEPQPPQMPMSWSQEDEATLLEDLTAREHQVLRLLAEGLPNKTIAQRLDISEHTVKFHVNAILGKLGVSSRTEAVVRATRLGLIFL